jgi:pyruvate, orthophosphate dikinase
MVTAEDHQLARIYAFDDALPPGSDANALLGGKGANLAEMMGQLGLPVPPGFVITTATCLEYLKGGWPSELDAEIEGQLERLAARMGRSFGDVANPLLVSVRSGAPVSMPGMMDTLLNVGMTPEIRDRIAETTGNSRFAADTWLRFCRMYAEIVLGIPRDEVAAAVEHDGTPAGLATAAERVRKLAEGHGGIPSRPLDQLRGAVAAVFRSWGSERARIFRAHEGISEDLGTAVTVQAMVFGNLDERSGTGVVFTRDPATGAPGPFGDYLARAQGEDVVAGTHSVGGLGNLRDQLPEVYDELLGVLDRLERHYRDMCDVEFTVSEGRLYILQTRIGRRSPLAAVRIAVAMAGDESFPLSRAEAVARVDAGVLQQLAAQRSVRPGCEPLARGLAASPGVAAGVLCCDPDRAADLAARNIAVVLARAETSPSDVHGMVGAAALVTTLGGVASHAAVVARGWGIPAVTSLNGATVLATGIDAAGQFIAEGEVVTVDGGTGTLYLGDEVAGDVAAVTELATIRSWAAELGLEPGTAAEAGEPGRSTDVTLLELARTVQLKGLCTPERAAAALSAATDRIEELLSGNEHVFKPTPRGVMLTPDGRTWVTGELQAERSQIDSSQMNACYGRFMELNHEFKRLVSEWQLKGTEPADADWEGLVGAVARIQEGLAPLLEAICGQAQRLRSYNGRFVAALEAMRSGDRTMLASPLKDSYHTVWFEYHEELITLCGRDRAEEEKAEAH